MQISEPGIYDFDKVLEKTRALQEKENIIQGLRITLTDIQQMRNLIQKR